MRVRGHGRSAGRALLPFLAVMVGTLLLITYVPEITLFLPHLLLGYVSK